VNDGTSVLRHFGFQGFLNRENQKKPKKTEKNPEIWQQGPASFVFAANTVVCPPAELRAGHNY